MSATSSPTEGVRRLTVTDIGRMYADGERIAMLTAYDFPTAKLLDEAGIPMLLVGDSLGRAQLGYENELSVTMADMLHHAAAVTRGARRALVIGDMPFLTYTTPEDALHNAGLFIHDAAVQAVKVEGGVRSARVIETLVKAGIPVMSHIGLTPQSANAIGKFRIQGKTGDPTNDPTLRWDDEDNRPTTPLGKISIDKVVPEETCDAGVFLPGNVVDGIAGPTNDPVFAARSPAYIVSLTRRKQ